jgi:hypothetical protein
MNNARIAETWTSRDLPILAAALRRLHNGDDFVDLEELRHEVGLDVATMRAGLKALESAWPPYIDVSYTMAGPDRVGGHIQGVSERCRRELGAWPSADGLVDRLAQALADAADREPEPERKNRLKTLADGLGGVARDVAVGVISAHLGKL